jgi:hypothetical protein
VFSITTVSSCALPLIPENLLNGITGEILYHNNYIIIIIFINCNWVVTRWQWLFNTYTKHEISLLLNFTSGGLHEKHVVATWNLGKHLSICLKTQGNQEKPVKSKKNQLNAQVFNLFYLSIYFCLTCFGLSFSPSSEAGVQLRQWFKSPGYGVSARAH